MKLKYFLFFFLSILLFNSTMVIGTVRFVSKTGSSTPPYTSWATASDSIQKCIDYAFAGDTIYVGNGIYKEKIIVNNKFLTLIGSGWDSCIVDAREFESFSNFDAVRLVGNCVFTGFFIKVSTQHWGAGIMLSYCDTISLIEYNKIENCSYGASIFNSYLTFKNNLIIEALHGIRLEAFDENYFPVVDSNIIITADKYSSGISGSFGTSATIRGNSIFCESGGDGLVGILYPKIVSDNLVVKHEPGFYGYYLALGEGVISNNLISGNSTESAFELLRGNNKVINNNIMNSEKGYLFNKVDTIKFRFNNAWNVGTPFLDFIPDTTNTTVDPMIVNEDSSDFHLQKYSPLIDAGDPSILDRDGSRSDIGLFGGPFGETYTYLDLAPKAPRNLSSIVDTNRITLRWNKNTESDTAYYKVYRDTVQNFMIESTKLVTSTTDTSFIQLIPSNINRYAYKIACVDKQGNESRPSEEVVVNLTSVDDYPVIINNFSLYQNYPNPFNPGTTIGYKLRERGYVKLMVYDIKGELISVLVNQEQEAGYYEVDFNLSSSKHSVSGPGNLASGVLLYKIEVINQNQIPVFTEVRKMLYIK